MKKQLIGIIVAVLVFVAILNADSSVIASPVTMIFFGAYLLWISWYGRGLERENKEYPLDRHGL